jgi:hypothetical protein
MATGDRWYFISPAPAPLFLASDISVTLELFGASHLALDLGRFVQLFDLDAAPDPGDPPIWECEIGPLGVVSYTPSRLERRFVNGLVAALSSTPSVYTPVPGDDLVVLCEGALQEPPP